MTNKYQCFNTECIKRFDSFLVTEYLDFEFVCYLFIVN